MIDEFTDEVSYHILTCGDGNFIMFACFQVKMKQPGLLVSVSQDKPTMNSQMSWCESDLTS